jgi:cytochrome c-type biogenesis protein CcmE
VKPAHLVALIVIAVSLGISLYAFSGAVAQHVDIRQAMARPGETVQVPGQIVKDTVRYDTTRGALEFDVVAIDPKTRTVDPGARMKIVYAQPKPENFDTAEAVEAIGTYRDGVFVAHNLLVKCPSKYRDEAAAKTAQR